MEQRKIDYYLRFSRFQQSREKFYAPKLRKALDAQVQQYISTRKFDAISSHGIASIITNLYADAASVYGGKIYGDLAKYIKQLQKKSLQIKEMKPVGFNERIIELMNQYFKTDILNTSRNITETTIRQIQDELVRASGLGLGFDEIVNRLISDNLNAVRARLIARTETVTAANRASYIVAKESGLEMNKEWLASIDNRTREHHILMDGKTIGIDEYFILPGGFEMLVPGDRGGADGRLKVPAGEVCNCRCTTVYIPIVDAQGNAVESTRPFVLPVLPKPIVPIAAAAQKPITTIEEAQKAMESFKVSLEEKISVERYSYESFKEINGFYRGTTKEISEKGISVAKDLDAIIKRAPKLTYESYRHISVKGSLFNEYKTLKPGDIYTDKGFISTTYDKVVTNSFRRNEFEIEITIKGKNGVLIENLSRLPEEKEVLFGRNSKFKVESIKEIVQGLFGRIILVLKEIEL